MRSAKAWLCAGAAVCTVAFASPPSPPPGPSASPPAPVPSAASPADQPDDEFIEFLGADDDGDVAWWDFLRGTTPRSQDPSAPPPSKDAKP